MFPSQEQRDEFLSYIRDGFDRSEAATKIGLTGTVFRRICNREPEFLKAYEEAFQEGAETRRQRKDGRCSGPSGYWEPSEEEKTDFLELVREGHTRYEAAALLNHTSLRWRGFIRRDAEFRLLYEEALQEGEGERAERIRAEYWRRAIEGGSDRLLANLGLVHLSEMQPLLNRRTEHSVTGAIQMVVAQLPAEVREAAIQALEEKRRASMEQGEVLELPTRATG